METSMLWFLTGGRGKVSQKAFSKKQETRMLDKTTIDKITKWGNSQTYRPGRAITDYDNKFFGDEFTEALRRVLHSLAIAHEPGLTGSWRKGYALHQLDGSVIGVGTYRRGYNGFAVFYIPSREVLADIPLQPEN